MKNEKFSPFVKAAILFDSYTVIIPCCFPEEMAAGQGRLEKMPHSVTQQENREKPACMGRLRCHKQDFRTE